MRRWVSSCCGVPVGRSVAEKEKNKIGGGDDRKDIHNQKINSDVSNLTNLALCFLFFFWLNLYFLFLSCNLFIYLFYYFFLCSNSLWTEIGFLAKYNKKTEPCEPLKPAMVLRTVWFDHGSSGFIHFSHREVLRTKRIGMIRGSWLIGLDHTVWSGSENLAYKHIFKYSQPQCVVFWIYV